MKIVDAITTRPSNKLLLWILKRGKLQERRLDHPEAAEKFYRELAAQGKKVRVGMEASGHARWFERVLAELNFELRAGSGRAISRTQDTGRCWRSWLVFREANRPPSNLRRCVGMIFILMLTIGSWKTKLWRCNREISSAWSELGSR